MSERTRILLVDDHGLFRDSVARMLSAEPDLEVTSCCASVEEAFQHLTRNPVDLVLLDAGLGQERGGTFLHRAAESGFTGRVLVVTAGMTSKEAAELLLEGVQGVFHKHGSPDELVYAIRQVMAGRHVVDAGIMESLLKLDEVDTAQHAPFSEIERRILQGVHHGLTNKELAGSLGISEAAVKAVLQRLFEKIGVRTRGQLVKATLEKHRELLLPRPPGGASGPSEE